MLAASINIQEEGAAQNLRPGSLGNLSHDLGEHDRLGGF